MPWTIAHAAAALPVYRLAPQNLHLPALCLGSLAPDLYYYFGCFGLATQAHSWQGFSSYGLAVAVLAYAALVKLWPIWHWFAPQTLRRRLPPTLSIANGSGWRQLCRVLVSLWLGTLTHVIWDGFTHLNGWAVLLLPSLNSNLLFALPSYKFLQHLSTLLGLLLIGVYVWKTPPDMTQSDNNKVTPVSQIRRLWTYLWIWLAASGLAVILLLIKPGLTWLAQHREASLFYFALTATTSFAVVFTLTAYILKQRSER